MSWVKIISATAIITFIFGIATIDCAMAGEKLKIKYHGASIGDSWKQIEVGDEEGHVLAISTAKQIYFDEITGEKLLSSTINFYDMNIKTGQGFMQGYGIGRDKDGNKRFRSFKGKSVGKGHWKGTYVTMKGTGKFEGIKGGGTWDAYSLAPGQSYLEVEGEIEMP